MITIRPGTPDDASAMVDLLNRIIEIGGTTAHLTPMTVDSMTARYLAPKTLISCVVAYEWEDFLGFQSLKWFEDDPADPNARPATWGTIASFVKKGQQGKGIGPKLFAATLKAAKDQNVEAIDATIRADNVPGLAYYEKMGFREDSRLLQVPLRDGTKIDRIRKVLTL